MSRHFREGANAALSGLEDKKNPFILLTPSWWSWFDGFQFGRKLLRMGAGK